ncbi:MAG: single-stranded DNA-binding protein [Anaerolineae bacterium]|nr:single-stranded DNA-binding protein [Anaerolineae bacterium]
MAGYQYTVIIGNVGRDPEMRYTQSGVAVCSFSVAVSRRWMDKNSNEQREKTTWFKVSAWRQLGETANQYVHKGMQIMVAGEVDASAYVGQDGQPRASLEITARDIQFLGRRGEAEETAGEAPTEADDLPF